MAALVALPAVASTGGGGELYVLRTVVRNDAHETATFAGTYCSAYGGGSQFRLAPGQSHRFSCHRDAHVVAMRFTIGTRSCAVTYQNPTPEHWVSVQGNLPCHLHRGSSDTWASYELTIE